ncbi:energy transducer TonB [Thalassomonas haliotis]|uniref:Energy transducer TonB n=1 Tax=Thalassomonas haliotis TaxID=485448 RepID=A0ABY7VJT1_9GAMM|nr:energy transducer TonB [Thalassomonas haliotis]WDE13713.1 energy transducer TonB [Thalassomonas haliotis]
MKHHVITLLCLFALTACNSTAPNHTNLPLTEAELLTNKWQPLKRVEPLYPLESAKADEDGCTTLEYVITPDNQIEDIKVLESSNRYFARQAKSALIRWNWPQLKKNIISVPVKTRTRFEFCIEKQGEKHCDVTALVNNQTCSGTDVVPVVGKSAVRRIYSGKL